MKTGKYVGHKFTKQELEAQRVWRRSDRQRSEIVEALKSCNHFMSRKAMHKRLDRRMDAIERMQKRAKELFPEVDESFTIATMKLQDYPAEVLE